uniref:Uncharacterized protein n=1 Tax=Timema bartmani TaxID=61472 RepID=A0A7R9EWF8_9NEOP|nr:unnamed protein product [Timema bartmani]
MGKVEFRGSEPAFAWRESGEPFRKNHPSSPDRDFNLDLPVLGGLAQHDWRRMVPTELGGSLVPPSDVLFLGGETTQSKVIDMQVQRGPSRRPEQENVKDGQFVDSGKQIFGRLGWSSGRYNLYQLVDKLMNKEDKMIYIPAYECHGLQNIPAFGPALIVYYKCDIPVDLLFLHSRRLSLLSKALRLVPATLKDCSVVLHEHQVLAVAAEGGQQYNLLYTPQEELYRMVLQAKVPVIPMFTQNVCEAHLTTRGWRLPVALLVGNFPVKLSTHLGKPISYSPNSTPRKLHAQASEGGTCPWQVMDAIEELIERNQKLPGSIPRALLERVRGTRRMEGEYPQFIL